MRKSHPCGWLRSTVVGAAGFEPARTCARQLLRLARLSVPPRPDVVHFISERALYRRSGMRPFSFLRVKYGLTAEGIASRVALYDNCGIMEMNSTQNRKRTRFEHLRPRRVRTIKMAPRVGFEPTTLRLTAGCSAVELPRNLPISCVLSERAR